MKSTKRARKAGPPEKAASPAAVGDKRLLIAVSVSLAIAALLLYARTFQYGFIAYDDDQYVYENATVKAGLSLANIGWALTTFFYANWHPLTWISYMLDAQLFGMNAGWFHAVNAILHAGATILLFLALERMTRKPWRCAIVAAIFALHPLHVESVAWISERKDVLSTFLEMVALLLYVRFAESRTVRRYLALLAVFGLSLMAKPMLVTFPFVLLLLDFWPLRRIQWPLQWSQIQTPALEKVPLLALSAVASVLTFVAQKNYGAVAALQNLPLPERFANAALGYTAYIGSSIWPANLGVLYPTSPPSMGGAFLAAVFLLGVTAVTIALAKSQPYLATGWFWYIGMLVPVIGIVQVGVQSHADRYAYVPLAGLSIAIVWAVADWTERRPAVQKAAGAIAASIVVGFAVAAYQQVGYWQSSRTLFEHTIAVTQGNYILRNNLGVVLMHEGKIQEAADLYRQALAIRRDYAEAHANLGNALLNSGQFQPADNELREALRLQPHMSMAQADFGLLQAARGNYPEAAQYLSDALRTSPGNAVNESNLCFVLLHAGRLSEAQAHCRESIRIKPDMPDAHFNLGNVFASQGQFAEARAEFNRTLEIKPDHPDAKRAVEALAGK